MASGPPPERVLDRTSRDEQNYEMSRLHTLRRPTVSGEHMPDGEARTKDPKSISRRQWKISIASPRIDAPLSSARDHLANERVFLAYFRTSSALATFAVVVLQLYRLGHDSPPPGIFTDYKIGIPLASTILIMAILATAIGAARFFKCQNGITASKFVSSGQTVSSFTAAMTVVSTWSLSASLDSPHELTLRKLLLILLIFTIIINADE
jgi:uncharacterized membrane protein YidH (DUF202 family)